MVFSIFFLPENAPSVAGPAALDVYGWIDYAPGRGRWKHYI
jgi:hypothetical protein